jgi:dihydrofolate reductase
MTYKGQIIIIAAAAENGVIGRNNTLPWSIKEDLARFKKLTLGFPCIMGRKTWESLPRKPLPGRLNVIISAGMTRGMKGGENAAGTDPAGMAAAGGDAESLRETIGGVKVCSSLEEGVDFCGAYEKVFICGGASLYRAALPLADRIELTRVHRSCEGDACFPVIDPHEWKEIAADNRGAFSFITLVRNEKVLS